MSGRLDCEYIGFQEPNFSYNVNPKLADAVLWEKCKEKLCTKKVLSWLALLAAAYCASKFGVVGFSKCVFEELKRNAIKFTLFYFSEILAQE